MSLIISALYKGRKYIMSVFFLCQNSLVMSGKLMVDGAGLAAMEPCGRFKGSHCRWFSTAS